MIVLACLGSSLASNLTYADLSVSWITQFGSSSFDSGRGIAVDANNDVWVTGRTIGNLAGSAGAADIFLSRLNSAGGIQAITQVGSSGSDEAFGLAISGDGSLWATGISAGNLGGQTNTASGGGFPNYAGAVLSFSSVGSFQFARLYGSNVGYSTLGVAAAPGGGVFSVGSTTSSFNGQNNAGNSDGYLIKHDASGATQWTRFIGTNRDESATAVTADVSGNAYVTGHGYDPVLPLYEQYLVAKYDASGTEVFAKYLGGIGLESGSAIEVDLEGNIYIAGNGTAGPPGSAFVAKLNPAGELLWTSVISDATVARALAIDARGHVWVAGATYRAMGGQDPFGGSDGFVAELAGDGQFLGGQLFGTSAGDEIFGLAIDLDGAAYVTGYTEGSLGGTSAGGYDIFVAKVTAVPEPSGAVFGIGVLLIVGFRGRSAGGPR